MSAIHELFKNAKALNKKIIAEVLEKEEKTLSSGIILTGSSVDGAMDDFRRARVISSGSELIREGDIIIYLRFVGSPAGDSIIILEENEVLAKEIN